MGLASLGGICTHSPALSSSGKHLPGNTRIGRSTSGTLFFYAWPMWETPKNLLLHATSTSMRSLMVARVGLGWIILHLGAKTTGTAARYQDDIPSSDHMMVQWALGSLQGGHINAGPCKPRVYLQFLYWCTWLSSKYSRPESNQDILNAIYCRIHCRHLAPGRGLQV